MQGRSVNKKKKLATIEQESQPIHPHSYRRATGVSKLCAGVNCPNAGTGNIYKIIKIIEILY